LVVGLALATTGLLAARGVWFHPASAARLSSSRTAEWPGRVEAGRTTRATDLDVGVRGGEPRTAALTDQLVVGAAVVLTPLMAAAGYLLGRRVHVPSPSEAGT